jgi:SAM-dependent methyltransferase
MVLFYLVMGLGVVTILIFLNYTTGSNLILIILTLTIATAIVTISSIMLPQFVGAPWVPTRKEVVTKMLQMSELKPGEVLYDLGSGDGRLVIAAARDFGAKSVGIEIDPFRVFYSRLKITQYHLGDKARIIRTNFFNVDLHDADVVVTFLLQETNDRLQKKLEAELTKPNSRVVSLVFQFKGWEEITSDKDNLIYVYRPRPQEKIV